MSRGYNVDAGLAAFLPVKQGTVVVYVNRTSSDQVTGERAWEAEIHRLKGELLRLEGGDAQADACFETALGVARRQGARSLELRAAASLAQLWRSSGRRDDARALLAPVYDGFSEGFDTLDLQDAKALLDSL